MIDSFGCCEEFCLGSDPFRSVTIAVRPYPASPHACRWPMPPPTRDLSRYPPQSELKAVLKALCPLNNFSLQEVLAPSPAPSAPLSPDQCGDCCRVCQLPGRPQRGINRARWYFGFDCDGYILVLARTAAAKRLWPQTAAGDALPVRLHRWLAMVEPGADTLHSCDDPSCIRRAHVTGGSRSSNTSDSWRRLRRLPRPPHPLVQTPRSEPPPALPPHDPNIAKREKVSYWRASRRPASLPARSCEREKL